MYIFYCHRLVLFFKSYLQILRVMLKWKHNNNNKHKEHFSRTFFTKCIKNVWTLLLNINISSFVCHPGIIRNKNYINIAWKKICNTGKLVWIFFLGALCGLYIERNGKFSIIDFFFYIFISLRYTTRKWWLEDDKNLWSKRWTKIHKQNQKGQLINNQCFFFVVFYVEML